MHGIASAIRYGMDGFRNATDWFLGFLGQFYIVCKILCVLDILPADLCSVQAQLGTRFGICRHDPQTLKTWCKSVLFCNLPSSEEGYSRAHDI